MDMLGEIHMASMGCHRLFFAHVHGGRVCWDSIASDRCRLLMKVDMGGFLTLSFASMLSMMRSPWPFHSVICWVRSSRICLRGSHVGCMWKYLVCCSIMVSGPELGHGRYAAMM